MGWHGAGGGGWAFKFNRKSGAQVAESLSPAAAAPPHVELVSGAEQALKGNRVRECLGLCVTVLQLSPHNLGALWWRARALSFLGHRQGAIRDLLRIARLRCALLRAPGSLTARRRRVLLS